MNRTTILLPEELKEESVRVAREHGISFGELVRRVLEEAVTRRKKKQPLSEDTLFADGTVYTGKAVQDLSLRHDDYLYGDR